MLGRRALERASRLARVGAVGAGRPRGGGHETAAGRDRPRRALDAGRSARRRRRRRRAAGARARRRAARRGRRVPGAARARSARTARFRACSSALDVPYVGAGVLGSALCIDKAAFKRLMAQAGLPQVRYEVVTAAEWACGRDAALERALALGLPELREAGAARFERRDLEGAATADELRAGAGAGARARPVCAGRGGGDRQGGRVLGDRQRRAGRFRARARCSRPAATGTTTRRSTRPAGWSWSCRRRSQPAQRERVRRIAADAFARSGCSGLARVDFFVTDEGRVL